MIILFRSIFLTEFSQVKEINYIYLTNEYRHKTRKLYLHGEKEHTHKERNVNYANITVCFNYNISNHLPRCNFLNVHKIVSFQKEID